MPPSQGQRRRKIPKLGRHTTLKRQGPARADPCLPQNTLRLGFGYQNRKFRPARTTLFCVRTLLVTVVNPGPKGTAVVVVHVPVSR